MVVVRQSLTEAVKWYRLSAEQGLAEGQASLGVMYDTELGSIEMLWKPVASIGG